MTPVQGNLVRDFGKACALGQSPLNPRGAGGAIANGITSARAIEFAARAVNLEDTEPWMTRRKITRFITKKVQDSGCDDRWIKAAGLACKLLFLSIVMQ